MSARPSFIVDVNKCTGCHACAMACTIENNLPVDRSWRNMITFNELHVPGIELLHLSLACNHCADAPCMAQCPADAYYRDEPTDAVLINADACVGCQYCAWVCPYDAPKYDDALGVMTKCTFCVDRQHQGLAPACTDACPTGALDWGELTAGQMTQEVPGFAEAGCAPAIKVVGLEEKRVTPETTFETAMPPWEKVRTWIVPKITLRHEWTLAFFTLLLAFLVGWFGSGQADPYVFPVLGFVGIVLSASHLGRGLRAPRMARNLKSSWLSREIFLVGGFLALATGVLWWPPSLADSLVPVQAFTLFLGLGMLFVVDAVYHPAVVRGTGTLHSAQVLWTGLLFGWAFLGSNLIILAAIIKLVFYLNRARNRKAMDLPCSPPRRITRLLTLIGGTVLTLIGPGPWLAVVLLLVSEALDRAEFYDELEIPTPKSLMEDELAARLTSS
jgi:Fe-S-cluster-containing dehydrogenase component